MPFSQPHHRHTHSYSHPPSSASSWLTISLRRLPGDITLLPLPSFTFLQPPLFSLKLSLEFIPSSNRRTPPHTHTHPTPPRILLDHRLCDRVVIRNYIFIGSSIEGTTGIPLPQSEAPVMRRLSFYPLPSSSPLVLWCSRYISLFSGMLYSCKLGVV